MCTISGEATQEAALEGMLRKVQDKWTGVELPVKQYKEAKDAYILGSIEQVQTVLEDSLATMATICSSRFVAGVLQRTAPSCPPPFPPLPSHPPFLIREAWITHELSLDPPFRCSLAFSLQCPFLTL